MPGVAGGEPETTSSILPLPGRLPGVALRETCGVARAATSADGVAGGVPHASLAAGGAGGVAAAR